METSNLSEARKLRTLTIIIISISIIIPAVVGLLLFSSKPALQSNINLHLLPRFHAILNSVTAFLLLAAWYFIRHKRIVAHKTTMLFALLLSVLFLASYLTYHSLAESTSYGGSSPLKYIYYFVLLSHILLAVIIVPLILFTLLRALTGRFTLHKKIARWTLPIWLYVAVSGVIVYLLISPYY